MISQCLNDDCWYRLASYLAQFHFKIIIYKEISHGVNQICSGHNFLVIPVSPWSPDADAMLAAAHTPTWLTHGVDSCKAPTPFFSITYADSLTQVVSCSYCKAAVGPDLDLSQDNSKRIKKIPNNSEKYSGNSQFTSYGDILDPTLHALALALPLCPIREEKLLKAIYLENWNVYTMVGLPPAQ